MQNKIVGEKLMELKEAVTTAHDAKFKAHLKLLSISDVAANVLSRAVIDGDLNASIEVLRLVGMKCDCDAQEND